MYCSGGLYDRARAAAAGNAGLLRVIEEAQTQHLVTNNDAEALAARGNANQALELYAAQGNWDKAHALVRMFYPSVLLCSLPHAP